MVINKGRDVGHLGLYYIVLSQILTQPWLFSVRTPVGYAGSTSTPVFVQVWTHRPYSHEGQKENGIIGMTQGR
ncbi:hypothetical protein [Nitrosomonas nitrosa]|uniref:hypothetical protein n=1 Tax=Nitrosomonas nitrosa TaxID=52442 RepID=UPI000D31E5B2|nr:hypothetical protein [Nitrosomonas nitrosa]